MYMRIQIDFLVRKTGKTDNVNQDVIRVAQ